MGRDTGNELKLNPKNPLAAHINVRAAAPFIIFASITLAGLYYVKWYPYYHKAIITAIKHSLGNSIISGNGSVPPAPSLSAAWGYSAAYFLSVWKAVILGLVLGAMIEALLPRGWIARIKRVKSFRSIVLAGAASIPTMMCSCCAAPIAVALRKRSASAGTALAFWMGNPMLNPATLAFMLFTLPWQFLALRLVTGVIIVLGASYLAERLAGESNGDGPGETGVQTSGGQPENVMTKWSGSFLRLSLDSIPIYFVLVLLLGAARAWLFPAVEPGWGNSAWIIIGFAFAGTLFMIPTAAEIPIVQSMLAFGLGSGPAAALLVTLPAISLPSLLMVRKVFSWKILILVGASTMMTGVISGIFAAQLLNF